MPLFKSSYMNPQAYQNILNWIIYGQSILIIDDENL